MGNQAQNRLLQKLRVEGLNRRGRRHQDDSVQPIGRGERILAGDPAAVGQAHQVHVVAQLQAVEQLVQPLHEVARRPEVAREHATPEVVDVVHRVGPIDHGEVGDVRSPDQRRGVGSRKQDQWGSGLGPVDPHEGRPEGGLDHPRLGRPRPVGAAPIVPVEVARLSRHRAERMMITHLHRARRREHAIAHPEQQHARNQNKSSAADARDLDDTA